VPTALALLAFAAALGLAGHRAGKDFAVPGRAGPDLIGMRDFRDAVYYPALAFRKGISPYHAEYVAFHPEGREFPAFSPLTLLVHFPFGLLELDPSALAFFCLSAVLVVAFARLALACCGLPAHADAVLAVAALIVLSRPGQINFYLGQLGVETALGSMLALHYAKRRPAIAGLGLAWASIKPNFAVPLALLMLARRDYRAVSVGAAAGGLGALVAAAVLVANYGSPGAFVEGLAERYGSLASQPAIPPVSATESRIDATSLVTRLAGAPPAGPVKLLLFCACLGVGLAGVGKLRGTSQGEGADSLSGVLIALSVLTCIYHQIYDAVLLAVPLLAVAAAKNDVWRSLTPARRGVLIALLALPTANYLTTTRVFRLLNPPGMTWSAIMSLNAAALLVALAACGAMALRTSRSPRGTA